MNACVASDGKLLITDGVGCCVVICDSESGDYLSQVNGISTSDGNVVTFKQPHSVVVNGTDKIMITDSATNSIFMF